MAPNRSAKRQRGGGLASYTKAIFKHVQIRITYYWALLDFRLCVGQSMDINGKSSCAADNWNLTARARWILKPSASQAPRALS